MITLDVELSDTIEGLKKQIQGEILEEEGDIPPEQQSIVLAGKSTEDGRTLSDYNFQQECTIIVLLRRVRQVLIRTRGGKASQAFTLNVAPSDTIAAVKTKIQEKEGIPVDQQCLCFAGNLLEDGRTLEDYRVRWQATLELVRGKSVYSRHDVYVKAGACVCARVLRMESRAVMVEVRSSGGGVGIFERAWYSLSTVRAT